MAREGRIWAVKVGREWRFRADRSEIHPAPRSPFPITNGGGPTCQLPRTIPASIAAIRGTHAKSNPNTEEKR
jgi:hypothetical protein